MPTDWINKLMSLDSPLVKRRNNTLTGKAMTPPPSGVDPATKDPIIMARPAGHHWKTAEK
jgi:hypothetical protein